uniref:Uncharacterized protein n=1 Tax=Tetranychus urticae TaxID=32264 RepID=T1KIG5_TETUR
MGHFILGFRPATQKEEPLNFNQIVSLKMSKEHL